MRVKGIIKDDGAQAIAEFVLVFPVMLLVFMLIIQHLIIVQASIVGNYAAYTACRVYAVRAALDPKEAEEKAITAAALAYAPVSSIMPGELGPPVGGPEQYLPEGVQDALGSVALAGNVVALAEGYAVARYIRLNEYASGGSVNISSSGSPAEVTVEINYAQPVLIPGLAQLWKLTGGNGSIVSDLKPMRDGLGTNSLYGIVGLYPSVNVRSKCTMGCEEWGSDKEKYRPRKRKTVDSDQAADPALEENAKKQQEAQKECEAADKKMQEKQKELNDAQAEVNAAQAEYDSVMADPNASDDAKHDAKTKLDLAKNKRDEKQYEYDLAREEYEKKVDELHELDKGPP